MLNGKKRQERRLSNSTPYVKNCPTPDVKKEEDLTKIKDDIDCLHETSRVARQNFRRHLQEMNEGCTERAAKIAELEGKLVRLVQRDERKKASVGLKRSHHSISIDSVYSLKNAEFKVKRRTAMALSSNRFYEHLSLTKSVFMHASEKANSEEKRRTAMNLWSTNAFFEQLALTKGAFMYVPANANLASSRSA